MAGTLLHSLQNASLVTPDLRSLSQSFFTGENWFCYWKASATLWSTKLEQYSGPSPLFVPFLWSHHVSRISSPNDYGAKTVIDFGQKRQDTNLLELFQLIKNAGREAILVVPLGPLPFVSSGGMPSWLCESVIEDKNGLPKVAIDDQMRIHKSYSFYSSRVFKEYMQTLTILADLIRSKGIEVKIYGMSSYYQDPVDHKLYSFFEDYSKVAKNAFARYFANLKGSGETAQEGDWKSFQKEMKSLYVNALQETFAGFYQGELSMLFADTSPWQPLTTLQMTRADNGLLNSIKLAWQNSLLPSFILSHHRNINGQQDIQKLYQATTPHDWVPHLLENNVNSVSDQLTNQPLQLLHLFGDSHAIADSGLGKILDSTYQGAWRNLAYFNEQTLEGWEEPKSLFLFDIPSAAKNHHLNSDPVVNLIIKTVMRGHQVAVNKEALTKDQIRLFEQFIHENQLKKILSGHYGFLEFISIGQAGKLCFFNATEVMQTTDDLKLAFWKQILRLFEVEFITWQLSDDIESLWMYRLASPGDLYYEQIRRVILRNKSSMDKNIVLQKDKKHILVKIIDPMGVDVVTKPQTIDCKFKPHGFVVLDFGFIGDEQQD